MIHLLYRILRALLRAALAVYFQRIEVDGDEDVPDGPLVIAATHPNAFVDVALVATRLDRRVHFVAKAPLFKNPIRGFFLRFMGALPVERRQDRSDGGLEEGAKEKNAQSLAACEELVASGGAVLIFPEGTSEFVPKLLPLKTGVARIALGACARRGANDVHVVPVAVRYDAPTLFRSRARVSFLDPIAVAPYREVEKTDPAAAVRALTGAIRDALEPAVVHTEEDEDAKLVARIDALYGHGLDATRGGDARLAAAPAIAQALSAFAKSSPERVAKVRELLAHYESELARAKVDDDVLRPTATRATLAQDALLLVGMPVAAWGLLHHVVPFFIPRLVTRAFIRDPASVAGVKLMVGMGLFTALWVGEGVAAGWFLGPAWGVAHGLTLPFAGVVTVSVIDALGARARRWRRDGRRVRLDLETRARLERARASLVAELDRARAEFLATRAEPVAEGLV